LPGKKGKRFPRIYNLCGREKAMESIKKIPIYPNIYFIMMMIFIYFFAVCVVDVNAETKPLYDRYLSLAIKLQKQKKYKQADAVFTKALMKYPNICKLYFFRAELRKDYLGNCRAAIKDYTMALKLKTNLVGIHPKAYYKRGLCMYSLGLHHYAINDFTNCLRIKPNYGGRVYLARARAHAKLSMISEAMRDLHLTVKYNPEYAETVYDLKMKILQGRFK
jgi:tetratricopeptide (TPR) repeat protein